MKTDYETYLIKKNKRDQLLANILFFSAISIGVVLLCIGSWYADLYILKLKLQIIGAHVEK